MKFKKLAMTLGALAATLLLSSGSIAADTQKDLVLKGDAKCTACHDEADAPELLRVGKTKHGTVADGRTPSCTSCHGDSDKHAAYKGKDKPPKPDVMFGKKSSTDVATRNESCLNCHQGGKHMNWQASTHAIKGVACTSCHTVHSAHDKVKDKLAQSDVCYTCHKEQRAQMTRQSHHPVPEGKMACSSCHEVHGAAIGDKLLTKDSVNATCFTCHAEKRGPFLHNHQPVEENCMNCHNPHGATADNMLRMRAPFLCQQCHGFGAHPGNVPGVTGIIDDITAGTRGVGTAEARGCSNCHTNIHGSNNPSNAGSGSAAQFFR